MDGVFCVGYAENIVVNDHDGLSVLKAGDNGICLPRKRNEYTNSPGKS